MTQLNFTNLYKDEIKSQLANEVYNSFLESLTDIKTDFTAADVYQLFEKPPEAHLGDYALPCFRFAKLLRKKPQDIALSLQIQLLKQSSTWIEKAEVAGAFLNIFIQKKTFAQYLIPQVLNEKFFQYFKTSNQHKERVMIEFSQPNTHKEFHVGHVRNVCLGDSLCRIYRYLGFPLIAANYIGDEGTHVAKCLWQVQKVGPIPANITNQAEWYGERYVEANQILSVATPEAKKIYDKEISTVLHALESKSGEVYNIWKQSRQICLDDFRKSYAWLDAHFDHYFYESELSEESQAIVDEYMAKGLFKVSEGAVGIDMSADDLGFFMARKSDGTTPYITKDLVLARRKFKDFTIDRSIYVVGSEQNFHFRQLFKALELMGFEQAKDCHHLSYALVNLPEGKMSSRAGNVITFSKLKNILFDELKNYLQKYENDWSSDDLQHATHLLAVGAIKYGMLYSDPSKDITFDAKLWTSFEGMSGPYLMYSYARTQSILTKCKELGFQGDVKHVDKLLHPHEHELMRFVYDFNEVVCYACSTYKPSLLATHLYHMCKVYNRFYAELPVLKAASVEERQARIVLIKTFALTLKQGLNLLGITPPEKM